DGRFVIMKYDKPGASGVPVSAGPQEMMPALSSDGDAWFFVNYETNAIVRCSLLSGDCSQILVDASIPAWPAPSPGGKSVAFLTQLGTPRLRLVPSNGGPVTELGPALPSC